MDSPRIKICQISDIHWRGSTRHEEYTKAFEQLLKQLREEEIAPNLIVCTGDIFHTKTQGITPEVIDKITWMFRELLKLAPVRVILGNHDGNLANTARQDAISPIVKAMNESDLLLYKESGTFIDPIWKNIAWSAFSCFDKENWNNVSPIEDKINIGLYHGSIVGCLTDTGHRMMTGEENISRFAEYDFVMMGDMHKSQFMAERADKNGIDKPWIAYPGSMIQQNFGEEQTKGYLMWEIASKDDWDVSFVQIPNYQPYINFQWKNSYLETSQAFMLEYKNPQPGTRLKIWSKQSISDIERRQLTEFFKNEKLFEEVVFVIDVESKISNIETKSISAEKTSLRNNPELIESLYCEFLNNNSDSFPLNEDQKTQGKKIINDYLNKLNLESPDIAAKNTKWEIKKFNFDNVFRYGEGNSIDFSNLDGIVGLFSKNKTGKSSLVGALMYALFNATDRGPIKTAHVINNKAPSCNAQVHVSINDTDYVIERSSQRDEPKKKKKKEADSEKTSTSLVISRISKDGTATPITNISRDESDKDLRKLIGTAEDFLLTSFASQENMNQFINEGATERKAILSRFLDLEIFGKLASYAKEDCSLLNAKTKKYTEIQWDKVLDDLKIELKLADGTKLVTEARIAELSQEIEALKVWLVSQETKLNLSSLESLQSKYEIKQQEILSLKKKEEEETIRLKAKLGELHKIKTRLSQLDIKSLEESEIKVSDMKKQLTELKAYYEIENHKLEIQEKSVKKLQTVPCGDSFPNCHYIKDAHENKEKIEQQRSIVSKLLKEYDDMAASWKEIIEANISEKIKDHRNLVLLEANLEKEISQHQNKIEMLNISNSLKEKEDLFLKLQQLKSSINEAEKEEILKKKEKLAELKAQIKTNEEKRTELLMDMGSLKQKFEQVSKEKMECVETINNFQLYESVYKAFSKTGIPAMILKSQLPAINKELEMILSSLVDFSITLDSDINSNAMDVFIEDSEGKRVIETASGMEKMIASLALRVALINLSNLPKTNIFILDESFGPLDETNIYQCMKLLEFLKNYFKTIIVITHIAPIKEIVDKMIDIKTDSSFSYVNV